MSYHIPFVFGTSDCKLVTEMYADSEIVRVPLDKASTLTTALPPDAKIWVDPLIDGLYPSISAQDQKWQVYIGKYANWNSFYDKQFIAKPNQPLLADFVSNIMLQSVSGQADYVTVPQLPLTNDTANHKINRDLAAATRTWVENNNSNVQLILPIILTNQQQLNKKTDRNNRIKNATTCYVQSGAHGYWVVDQSLSDHKASKTFRERYRGIIDFHDELNAALNSPPLRIGGPYWGLNLVLWAKGLITHPAIGIGRGYQYFFSGGIQTQSKTRIALTPLRRLAIAQPELRQWIDKALEKLNSDSKAYQDFYAIRNRLSHLLAVKEAARRQIAQSYKDWYNHIESTSPAGRALALYQDLSTAYVLGKSLHLQLPSTEAPARRPEQVAEILMMQCL